jgi:hypothetical protein
MPSGSYGRKALGLTVALHAVCLALATYPTVLSMGSTVPDRGDTLQHLWVMRWYKTCLLEGRSVVFCPEIQYPAGSPFGNFSPLHAQTLLYLPLYFVLHNDALCFNLIWTFGLLLTGLGTSLLVWRVVGDRPCAAFGGLAAMLSAPLLCHAQRGHSELLFLGTIPLFLVAWMRFVDRPGLRSLALAGAAYVAVAMSAAYYMVFAIFPAVLYLGWEAAKARSRPWVRERAPWLLGMVGLTLPCLLVLFSSHVWAIAHGYSMGRSRDEFDFYAVSLLGYLTPSPRNALHALLPPVAPALNADSPPYIGAVTILLLGYAALGRLKGFAYWWSALALMVVLSLGTSATIASRQITLPAGWLWSVFPPIRLTRVPSRFCMLASVFASVIAAGGLRNLLARVPGGRVRASILGVLTVATVADLGNVPFSRVPLPEPPGCYAFIRERDPAARILEVPFFGSGGSFLNLTCLYWQSRHRLTTSAGSSGRHNELLDRTITDGSPFLAHRLADPGYLADPDKLNLDLTNTLEFNGYLWAYLTLHRFDYVVLHQWKGSIPGRPYEGPVPPGPVRLDRVKALLKDCQVYEDGETVVYARSLLKPPTRPVALTLPDWPGRTAWKGRWNSALPQTARFLVYNPDAGAEIALQLDAATFGDGETVRLLSGPRELARWQVGPGDYQSEYTPPFRLDAGFQTLTLISGTPGPSDSERLRVARLVAMPASWLGPVAAKPAGGTKDPATLRR